MANILAIDTSTEVCSVALHSSSHDTILIEENRKYFHASILIPLVQRVLMLSEIKKPDAISIASGPGSYTGLRIGFGTVKALCYAWRIPLMGISSLYCVAKNIQGYYNNSNYIIPVIDSRQGEIYAAVYDHKLRVIESEMAYGVEELHSKISNLDGEIAMGGNGIYKYINKRYDNSNILVCPAYSSSKGMISKSLQKFELNKFESVSNYKPLYLKYFKV